MKYRPLGKTGIDVSEISLGAGPVSGLMTEGSLADRLAVVSQALEHGVNWIDTAAGYGEGRSEAHLGEVLRVLRPVNPVHVATKVRLRLSDERDLRPLVIQSVRASLDRLQLPHVTLLQLHNSITEGRGDEPTSLTVDDVLGPTGVLAAFHDLRADGLVRHFGLTGIGQAQALSAVIQSQHFETIQAPFHLLNPSALLSTPQGFREPDYGGFLRVAAEHGMGLLAIRVYAAGALLNAPPSAHTRKTPFFPLDLYERDHRRARRLISIWKSADRLRERALRFVLSQPEFASAIVGCGHPEHVADACRIAALGPLSPAEQLQIVGDLNELVAAERDTDF